MRTDRVRPLRRAAQWEERFWNILEHAVPDEVRLHLQSARTEILRAVKSVVDDAVARSEGTRAKRDRRTPKAG